MMLVKHLDVFKEILKKEEHFLFYFLFEELFSKTL